MKTKYKGTDRWKVKDIRAKQKSVAKAKNLIAKIEMEENLHQQVKVIFPKKLWNMEYYSSCVINFKNPLSRAQIMERMRTAFPKLDLIEEEI